VPQFTEDNLQRIIINPFYAITVAPQLTGEHEPPMGEAEWVQANSSLMEEMGTERWLRHLLDVLEGKVGAPDELINPSRTVNIDSMFAAEHPPLIGRDMWVDVNVKHIRTQHGDGKMAQADAGCAQGRHRDGGRGRLSAAGRHVRLRRTRQV